MYIKKLSNAILEGQISKVKELVLKELQQGTSKEDIINKGLLGGMELVGEKFKYNEIYIPEVLIATNAMKAGMEIVRSRFNFNSINPLGKIVIGTIEGDIHDVGKNLVIMIMESYGFEVIDLGINVSADVFIETAEKYHADFICISALLTTAMVNMKDVIDKLQELKIREKYMVMVGGGPVTLQFARLIGADFYTYDAMNAAEIVKGAIQKRRAKK